MFDQLNYGNLLPRFRLPIHGRTARDIHQSEYLEGLVDYFQVP